MPECYASSQRVDSLARVVITPLRHTHTRLHTPLSNICSSPSSLQHTRELTSPTCLLPQPYPQCSVLRSGLLVLHHRQGEPLLCRRTVTVRQCNSVETAQLGDRTINPGIVMPECYASSQRVDSLARVVITPVRPTHTRLHIYPRIALYTGTRS